MYNVNLKIGDLTNKYQNICHRNILNHLCNSKKILLLKISQQSFHCYFCKNKKHNCIEIFIVFVFLFSNQNHYFFFFFEVVVSTFKLYKRFINLYKNY